jgi:hypothetical protein
MRQVFEPHALGVPMHFDGAARTVPVLADDDFGNGEDVVAAARLLARWFQYRSSDWSLWILGDVAGFLSTKA